MGKTEEGYSAFEQAMDNDEIWRNDQLSFRDICRLIRVRPSAVEKMILSELGFTGQELVDRYRFMCMKRDD